MELKDWHELVITAVTSSALGGVLIAWLNRRKVEAEANKTTSEKIRIDLSGAIEVKDAALDLMRQLKAQLDALKAEHDALQTDHAELRKAFAQLQEELKNEERTRMRLEEENAQLRRELEEERAEKADLLRRLELLESRVAHLESENEDLKRQEQ